MPDARSRDRHARWASDVDFEERQRDYFVRPLSEVDENWFDLLELKDDDDSGPSACGC